MKFDPIELEKIMSRVDREILIKCAEVYVEINRLQTEVDRIEQLKKTDITDVYETFILDSNDILVKNGVAYIPTMKTSQYCDQVFSKVKDDQPIIFKCSYSDAFKKWLPLEEAKHVGKPDSLEKIQNMLNV